MESYIIEGISDKRVIKSSLSVMLMHMLKLKYQNEYSNKISWINTIRTSFANLVDSFKGIGKGTLYNLFYMRQLDLNEIYKRAVRDASFETGLPIESFPKTCEWTKEQLTDLDFIYDFIKEYSKDIDLKPF